MDYQMPNMKGSLFANREKDVNDPNDKKPHFQGRCVVNGREWEVAGWWCYTQAGDAYLSLSFQLPREQRKQQREYQQQTPQQNYQRPAPQAPAPAQQQQRRPAAPPIPPAPMPAQPAEDNPADDLPF